MQILEVNIVSEEEYLIFLEEQIEEVVNMVRNYINTCFLENYMLEYRLKSLNKINLKLSLFERKHGRKFSVLELPDIIGLRISVDDEISVPYIVRCLLQQEMFQCYGIIDYFNNPKKNGFKAALLQFKTQKDGITYNFEIQIMTRSMRKIAEQTHQEHDREKYGI